MKTAEQVAVTNPYLDDTLNLQRGPDGVTLSPSIEMCSSGDGYVHFSIPTTVAEEAAWWALDEEHAVPSSMSVNLVRPAHVSAGELVGKGAVIKAGRQILTARGDVFQDDKLIATVTVSFCRFVKS